MSAGTGLRKRKQLLNSVQCRVHHSVITILLKICLNCICSRSPVWLIFFSCAQNGLLIDVSRKTTLSVEAITQAVSSITVSTLEEGTAFETAIVEQQTAVMSTTKALNIPFKFPLSPDLVSEIETPLLDYVKGLGDGNLNFTFNVLLNLSH